MKKIEHSRKIVLNALAQGATVHVKHPNDCEAWNGEGAKCSCRAKERHDELMDAINALISDTGEVPTVYTKEQVKAVLQEVVDGREAVRNSPEGMVWATPMEDIKHIAAKHGITL